MGGDLLIVLHTTWVVISPSPFQDGVVISAYLSYRERYKIKRTVYGDGEERQRDEDGGISPPQGGEEEIEARVAIS